MARAEVVLGQRRVEHHRGRNLARCHAREDTGTPDSCFDPRTSAGGPPDGGPRSSTHSSTAAHGRPFFVPSAGRDHRPWAHTQEPTPWTATSLSSLPPGGSRSATTSAPCA